MQCDWGADGVGSGMQVMVRIECRGMVGEAAETLACALQHLVAGLQERDAELGRGVACRLVVADDFAAALAEEGVTGCQPGVVCAIPGPDGALLVLDGRQAAAALTGMPEELARLVHLLHRELWRVQVATRRQASPAPVANEFERHFQPVVEALWADRKSTRLNSSHHSISYAVFC